MKWLKRIFFLVIIIVILAISIISFLGYQEFRRVLDETPLDEKVASIESGKYYIMIDELPKIYLDAVVAVEDHRFYEHGVVDFISIGRALITNIKERELVEGGSTITQQLAKNTYFTQNKSFIRKIAEIFMAAEIESKYSKDKILELYVNTSYFGDGYYGIKRACDGYFKKEPKDMTLYEATLIAGVPNAPSVYAPTKNLDLAEKRQKQVIYSMLEYGKITQEEASSILNKNN